MLLVGLTLVSPMPLSHIVPALVVMLLALAYWEEEDGLALLIAQFAALCSLSVTGAVWGAGETIDWIDPARH